MGRNGSYVLVALGLILAGLLVFSRVHVAGAVCLILVGASSILLSRRLAASQKQIDESMSRLPLSGFGGERRPLLFTLWGIGILIVGIALLVTWW